MKNTLILLLFSFSLVNAQNGMYYKTETVYEGKMGGMIPSTSTEMFSRGGEYKMILNMGANKNIQSHTTSKVSMFGQEGSSSPDCAEGTPKEFEAATKKYGTKGLEFKSVEVKKTGKTETILGYECEIAKISYEVKMGMGLTSKSEETVWYTDKIKSGSSDVTMSSDASLVSNDYTNALGKLGFVLKKETKTKGMMGGTTTFKVTELKQKDISDDDLAIGMECKKTLTIEQYYKLLDDREQTRRKSEMERNQMMKGY